MKFIKSKKYKSKFKFSLFTVLFVSAAYSGFAQSKTSEIELGEITTVVNTDSIKADSEAAPDFANVLDGSTVTGNIVPVLPDVEKPAEAEIAVTDVKEEKSLYADGLLGGGYPVYFTGNFNIYNLNGESPFKLSFNHDSATGYAGKSLTSGYFDRKTSMLIEKSFIQPSYELEFSGSYETSGNGLQNKVLQSSYVNKDFVSGNASFLYRFNELFSIRTMFTSDFYDRYEDKDGTLLSLFDFSPLVTGTFSFTNINFGFTGRYRFDGYIDDMGICGHRADLKLFFDWHNDFLKLFADVSAVVGNKLNENSVVVPFTAGASVDIPVSFSERKVSLGLKGGLNSYRDSTAMLESKYLFTALNGTPCEASDWFGRFDILVPVQNALTFTGGTEFRKSAFDNFTVQADYSSAVTDGLYGYKLYDITRLKTEFGAAYSYKIFNFAAQWNSYWMDVPVLESAQSLKVKFAVQNKKETLGADASAEFFIGDYDNLPLVSAGGFIKVNQSFRVLLSLDDILKLMFADTRDYAGCYVQRGGTASLLLKFNF